MAKPAALPGCSASAASSRPPRALAERVIGRAFPGARPLAPDAFTRPPALGLPPEDLLLDPQAADSGPWRQALHQAVDQEAHVILHLVQRRCIWDDLLLRRTGLGDDPGRVLAVAPLACRLLGWTGARAQAERARLEAALAPVRPLQAAGRRAVVP
jgi:glycerol-3-phosphate dehydrogenase